MKKNNFLKVATIFMGLTLLFNACSEDPVAPPVPDPVSVSELIESFSDAKDKTDFEKEGWENQAILGNRKWQGKVFEGNTYLQATAHNAPEGNLSNQLWSPILNVKEATKKVCSFKTAKAYWKETTSLKIYIVDYPTMAEKEIKPTLPTADTKEFEFVSTGDIDLSAYKFARIKFVYEALGGASNSTTWCLDDFEFNNTAISINFTSSAVTSVASGAAYQYSITTQVVNGVGATTISATGLPAWATLTDKGDGTATITGTAPTVTADESSQVAITATNNGISQTQSYTLTVTAPTAGGEGNGSAGAPYTVAQAIQKQGETQKFVKGYIVGIVKNGVSTYNTPEDAIFSGTFDSSTNVFIADSADETDPKKCINVKLNDNPSAVPTMRNLVNLKDHPENKGKILTVEGDLKAAYTNLFGMRTIKSFDLK